MLTKPPTPGAVRDAVLWAEQQPGRAGGLLRGGGGAAAEPQEGVRGGGLPRLDQEPLVTLPHRGVRRQEHRSVAALFYLNISFIFVFPSLFATF